MGSRTCKFNRSPIEQGNVWTTARSASAESRWKALALHHRAQKMQQQAVVWFKIKLYAWEVMIRMEVGNSEIEVVVSSLLYLLIKFSICLNRVWYVEIRNQTHFPSLRERQTYFTLQRIKTDLKVGSLRNRHILLCPDVFFIEPNETIVS